jgi:hypothetical protein
MDAMAAALKIRRAAGVTLWAPVCVYDLADQLGVEVRFVEIPSMEGMYCKSDLPAIFVSSLRPSGRQAFNCAHELGHYVFKHGSRIDKMIAQTGTRSQFDPEEFIADCFAGFLLMPKSAVERAFTLRGWDLQSCRPIQLYIIAGWLGVGYTTLVHHLGYTLNLIPQSSVRDLIKVPPNKIRSARLGKDINENLVIVDEHWSDRAIDIQVGDLIQLPLGTLNEGDCVRFHSQDENSCFFVGMAPGRGRFFQPSTGWSAYVRVSRRDYVGRSIFRHLEDPPDD